MGKPNTGTSSNIWTYASHGDVANVERIVKEEGEDVDVQNKMGESAAHMAARNGHVSDLYTDRQTYFS